MATRVLLEPDPALDIAPERRFMANIAGEPRTYSVRLRESVADTGAFLAGYVGERVLDDGGTGEQHAYRLVNAATENLTADVTGRAWQSLADVMPLLAEALPDRFLAAVEASLAGDDPPVLSLFMDSETAGHIGVSSAHIRLMQALKVICWSPGHMSRAAAALARLADLDPDPEAQSAARLVGCLAEVFNLYKPQTSLPLGRRFAVLDRLRMRSPWAAWTVLRAILPARLTLLPEPRHPR